MFDNVRLLYAEPFVYAVSGMSWSHATIAVHARNIGASPSRKVFAVHTPLGSTNWSKTQIPVVKDCGTHSLYQHDLAEPAQEFAIAFDTDAGSWWDSNNGYNYRVSPWSTSPASKAGTVGGCVGLVRAQNVNSVSMTKYGIPYIKEYKISADIAVENTAYNKRAGLRMSWDVGYKTWLDVDAHYAYAFETGGSQNIEIWKIENFLNYAHPLACPIRFAVYYFNLDHKVQYWDNNFWQDYYLAEPTGSEVV